MKKRISFCFLCILSVLFLFVSTPQISSAAISVTFVAVNDDLMELGAYTPITSGVIYVPGSLFSEGLGIVFVNNSNNNMASLYTNTRTLIFDLNEGVAYDTQGVSYSASALQRDGRVYLPLDFVCSYFGLSYSWSNIEFGTLLRIKNSSAVLTDTVFISASNSMMQRRYNAYVASIEESSVPEPDSPVEPVQDTQDDPQSTVSFSVGMLICGILDENTANILDILDTHSIKATFFTDATSISENSSLVRRIYCSGHTLGALAGTVEQVENFNTALDAVLSTKSRLVCTDIENEELASAGYAVIVPHFYLTDRSYQSFANIRSISSYQTSHIFIENSSDIVDLINTLIYEMGNNCYWSSVNELDTVYKN